MGSHAPPLRSPIAGRMIESDPAAARWFRAGFSGRGKTGRVLWGILGAVAMLGACGGTAAALSAGFTPWTMISGDGESYVVNGFESMYFLVSLVASAGIFAIWKACHRGGLGFWRANIRPALMCMFLAVMGIALTFELSFAAGVGQLLGLGVFGAAALGFVGLWYLRGPKVTIGNHDDYWNRAWSFAFTIVALIAFAGAGVSANRWRLDGLSFDRNAPTFRTVSLRDYGHIKTYTVPQWRYNHVPVAGGLMMLVALGSVSEVRYRRRQAALAREILLGQG